MSSEYISVKQILSLLTPDLSLQALKENIEALPSVQMYPCSKCPSFVPSEEQKGTGRCKKLGFWFDESFTCGYCETTERKKKPRF